MVKSRGRESQRTNSSQSLCLIEPECRVLAFIKRNLSDSVRNTRPPLPFLSLSTGSRVSRAFNERFTSFCSACSPALHLLSGMQYVNKTQPRIMLLRGQNTGTISADTGSGSDAFHAINRIPPRIVDLRSIRVLSAVRQSADIRAAFLPLDKREHASSMTYR